MTQFLRDQASDSEEVVTALMLDGTYLSRNFATLGPLTWQPPCSRGMKWIGGWMVSASKGRNNSAKLTWREKRMKKARRKSVGREYAENCSGPTLSLPTGLALVSRYSLPVPFSIQPHTPDRHHFLFLQFLWESRKNAGKDKENTKWKGKVR